MQDKSILEKDPPVRVLTDFKEEKGPHPVSEVAVATQTIVLMKRLLEHFPALGSVEPINWLEKWGVFQFRNDLPQSELAQIQENIEIGVRGFLQKTDQAYNGQHTISFTWTPRGNNVYRLEAYLNPSAVRDNGPGGGGTGAISPTPPKMPPPPPLGT